MERGNGRDQHSARIKARYNEGDNEDHTDTEMLPARAKMNILPVAAATTATATLPRRRRNTVHGRRRTRKDDFDQYLGMADSSARSASSMSLPMALSTPLSEPPRSVGLSMSLPSALGASSMSLSMPISKPLSVLPMTVDMSMLLPLTLTQMRSTPAPSSAPSLSMPATGATIMTAVPTTTSNPAPIASGSNRDLQAGLIIITLSLIAGCILIIMRRRWYVVDSIRSSSHASDDGSMSTMERDPETPKLDEQPAISRQPQGPFQLSPSWQSSDPSVGPIFVPVDYSDSQSIGTGDSRLTDEEYLFDTDKLMLLEEEVGMAEVLEEEDFDEVPKVNRLASAFNVNFDMVDKDEDPKNKSRSITLESLDIHRSPSKYEVYTSTSYSSPSNEASGQSDGSKHSDHQSPNERLSAEKQLMDRVSSNLQKREGGTIDASLEERTDLPETGVHDGANDIKSGANEGNSNSKNNEQRSESLDDCKNALDEVSEQSDGTTSDQANISDDFIGIIEEITEKEKLVLERIAGDLNQILPEQMDAPGTEKWRDGLRQDIRSGIDNMCSIHQHMLEQHAMRSAPKEIQDEYYRALSQTTAKRAELESKKIELETKQAELELNKLELEIIKVDEEKKIIAAKVSDDSKESSHETKHTGKEKRSMSEDVSEDSFHSAANDSG